ncbi:MAG TPA: zf-HC2 domain-containing protein [Pyrinomonadaceae bacterium]|nr:zf-HC2 domain-containing protein [Pyrinomonadaceae bacterium]
MNCKQVEDLLPLYAGGDLEEKRARSVAEHVRTCAACARVADEYRDSVQLTEQFAPPVFSEAVYAGIRQRVLREIETEAPSWSQTIASVFRPRLTWAIAGVLLIVVSMFAIYFIVNKRTEDPKLANKPPANSVPQDSKQEDVSPPENTGSKKQEWAGASQPRRKKSRANMNTVAAKSPVAMPTPGLPEPVVFPLHDSAASVKPLRVEIQTKDPRIRIIWFVQQETNP